MRKTYLKVQSNYFSFHGKIASLRFEYFPYGAESIEVKFNSVVPTQRFILAMTVNVILTF